MTKKNSYTKDFNANQFKKFFTRRTKSIILCSHHENKLCYWLKRILYLVPLISSIIRSTVRAAIKPISTRSTFGGKAHTNASTVEFLNKQEKKHEMLMSSVIRVSYSKKRYGKEIGKKFYIKCNCVSDFIF